MDLETFSGDRDFILNYRLVREEIQSGLLLFEGQDEKIFLGMVKPPQRVQPAEIPPREYIFVVDVSRSMNGFPLNIAKKLLRNHSEKGVRAIMRLPLNKPGENR